MPPIAKEETMALCLFCGFLGALCGIACVKGLDV